MGFIGFIVGVAAGSLFAASTPQMTRAGWRLLSGGYFFKDEPPAGSEKP